jgi:hypothetical protein
MEMAESLQKRMHNRALVCPERPVLSLPKGCRLLTGRGNDQVAA